MPYSWGMPMPSHASRLLAPLFALVASVAAAQEPVVLGGGGEDLASVSFELDVRALLTADRVLADSASGPVWTISAESGTRLVQIPLAFHAPEKKAKAGSNALDLDGARFAAYRLLGTSAANRAPAGSGPGDDGDAKSLADSVPKNAPHFTRDFRIEPDGTISWRLEQYVYQGEVTGRNNYAFKIDRGKLRKTKPDHPGRGADRGRMIEYRRERDRYLDRLKKIRDLPKNFAGPLPSPVWAIFELSGYKSVLELDGPDPLPWKIGLELLNTLRAAAGGGGGGGEWIARARERIVNDPHPYTLRLVAHTIARSGAAGRAAMASPLHQVMRTILNGGDKPARQALLEALVQVQPPTPVSRGLVQSLSADIAPELQLMSLEGMVAGKGEGTPLQQLVQTTNRMLRDESGPAVRAILDLVQKGATNRDGGLAVLVQGIRFRAMPADRRGQAIVYAIEHAPISRLCAGWLNRKLLGAPSRDVRAQTLKALGSATRGQAVLAPVTEGVLDAFFPRGDESASGGRRRPQLEKPIPLRSANHNIFSAIRSGDADLRRLAWEALPLFRVGGADAGRAGALPPSELDRIYETLISAALDQSPTPEQVVAFLDRQAHESRTTAGLIKLVVRASSEASEAAARALYGSGRSVAVPIRDLSPGERVTFAENMYRTIAGRPPLVVEILYERTSKAEAATWFGKRVVGGGELPSAGEWIRAFDREAKLLRLATSSSQRLRLAAAHVLVASVGGDRGDAERLASAIDGLETPDIESLEKTWNKQRTRLLNRRLRQQAGPYRLVLRIEGGEDGDARPRVEEIGRVTLTVQEEGSAQLGNKNVPLKRPGSRFALVLEDVSALKNLAHSAIAALPLGEIDRALELSFEPGWGWRGETRLPDGRSLEIELRAVEARR